MKKMAVVLAMAVFMAVTIFSLPAFAEKVPITEENLALLKGKWEGDRSVKVPGVIYLRTELEIINDRLPVEGVIFFHVRMGSPVKFEFKNGTLEKGKILIPIEGDSRNWMRLSLHSKSGKLKLEGDYQIAIPGGFVPEGSLFLTKKQ